MKIRKMILNSLIAFSVIVPVTLGSVAVLAEENTATVEKQKIRTIITADWLDDDQCSLVRYLLYANEYELEGIIADKTAPGQYPIAGGVYEFDGKEVMNSEIAQVFIDAYAKDFENLSLHAEGYPTPEYLTEINVDGNIEYNDFMSDTEGSALIKECIMDDREDMLFIQCWGGTGTICSALRSIEEEYKDTEQWQEIYDKVCSKVVIWHDLGQDMCFDNYLFPSWPNLQVIMSYSQFGAMLGNNIPADQSGYYAGQWVADYITNGSSALSTAYANIKGGHRESNASEDVAASATIAEGDTPNFFYILNNGLRQWENPSYGGWGGRFIAVEKINWNIFSKPMSLWIDAADDGDLYKPLYRWTEDFQNDFAARMEWASKSYEEANHEPVVIVKEGIDFTAERGETITLTAEASDPDGNNVNVSFWQYGDADTYGGDVELVAGEENRITITVPEDARDGDTIHIIVEAEDDGAIPLTRYQRVIISLPAAAPSW